MKNTELNFGQEFDKNNKFAKKQTKIFKLDQKPEGPNLGLFLDLKRNKATKYFLASLVGLLAVFGIGFGISNNLLEPLNFAKAATPTLSSAITAITIENFNYTIAFTTTGYTNAQGGIHTHFYFNNQQNTVMDKMYFGVSPYSVPVLSTTLGATQLCTLVSNPDHSIIPGSGNCFDLPQTVRTGGEILSSYGVSNIQISKTVSSVSINYTTAISSSSTIDLGLTATTTQPVTSATETISATSHQLSLNNLLPCTTYFYTLKTSFNGQPAITLPTQKFTTDGCNGDLSIELESISDTVVSTVDKAISQLDTESNGISMDIPAGAFPENRTVQISKLNRAVNIATNQINNAPTLPNALKPVAKYVYEVKDYVGTAAAPSTDFVKPISFSINYSPADVTGLDLNTLTVKSWDGAATWFNHACTNDVVAYKITCSTTHFTTFVLAGNSTTISACTSTDPCAIFETSITYSPTQALAKRYGGSGSTQSADLVLNVKDARLNATSLCTFKYKFKTDTAWRNLTSGVVYDLTNGCSATLLKADQTLFNVDFEITANTGNTDYYLAYSNYDFKAGSIGVTSIGGSGL